MSDVFLPADGAFILPHDLALPRARALAGILADDSLPFVRLVECRRATAADGHSTTELLVVDVSVERPQAPVYDIRKEERLALVFHAADRSYPEVLALRPDFPRVSHLNFGKQEFPRSLCLYDQPWSEITLRWTPIQFVELIRTWLALTAKGMLHQDDQPLEPLLFGSGLRIILPADLFSNDDSVEGTTLDVYRASQHEGCRTLIAIRPHADRTDQDALKFVATTLAAKPQKHGIIRKAPANILELHDFLSAGGINLVDSLRTRIQEWNHAHVLNARLIIIVAFPLVRVVGAAPEKWDFWAFLTDDTIRKIGVDIGLWSDHNGNVGLLIGASDDLRGQASAIDVMSPYVEFTRTTAATASGLEPDSCKVLAIGAGALGSQVITTLARSGFGQWTIADQDDLLPHNLARHALNGMYVGRSKAVGMAFSLNQFYRNDDGAKAIVADVLSPGDKEQLLRDAFSGAELIFDLSASVPVARHLVAGIDSPARRVSVFLNPQGTDLVVLAEDSHRTLPLDALEVQYYRAAATDPRLDGHLASNAGRLRYGRSCGDISTSMPAHLVTMHAAIASEAIRRIRTSEKASINVWRCEPKTLTVTPVDVSPHDVDRQEILGWTLILDNWLLNRIAELRQSKLPNETGGVLVGVHDLQHRVIYVVDTVPSPPDSEEWPTLYIRGSQGLLDRVKDLSNRSGNQLEYVGVWHSHPNGCSTFPSSDDMQVFVWLTERLAMGGYPALMAIAGGRSGSRWFLGEMVAKGGWNVRPK